MHLYKLYNMSNSYVAILDMNHTDEMIKKLNWTSILYDQNIFIDSQLYRRWDRSLTFEGQELLNKDLIRTRTTQEYFRKESTRKLLKRIATFYCIQNKVNYQQGLLEVVIPFALLKSKHIETRKCYAYFNSFMKKCFPRVLTQKTIENRKELPHAILAISLTQILLNFHCSQVYEILKTNEIPLSMVVTQQILTVFAKNIAIPLVYEIFNFFINKQDKNYLLYMSVAIIALQSHNIIALSEDNLHSFVNKQLKNFTTSQQLKVFFEKSQQIERQTPQSFKKLSKKIGFCEKSFFTYEDYERMMKLQQSLIDCLMPIYQQEIDRHPDKYVVLLINGEVPSKKYNVRRIKFQDKTNYPPDVLKDIPKDKILVFGYSLKNEKEQIENIKLLMQRINSESGFRFKMMILQDKLESHQSCQIY